MKPHGVAIERWDGKKKIDVLRWLEQCFGPMGEKWLIDYDFGLENLDMDEDVYIMYCLKWK